MHVKNVTAIKLGKVFATAKTYLRTVHQFF